MYSPPSERLVLAFRLALLSCLSLAFFATSAVAGSSRSQNDEASQYFEDEADDVALEDPADNDGGE